MRSQCEARTRSGSGETRDALVGAAITLAAALGVAAIMIVGNGPVTETIGLTMLPGVLVLGASWIRRPERSWRLRATLSGGMLLVLFLIGLIAGLARGG